MITIYGIKNCDTVKRALAWCKEKNIEHQFHDFRKDGLERPLLEGWTKALGVDILLNKRGTTWRNLPDSQKNDLTEKNIINLLLAHPSMIKRPVFDFGSDFGHVKYVGFSKTDQNEISFILEQKPTNN